MELDSNHRYLLYCDRGVMSGLHAQQLLGDGYDNVAVYRPTSS
jgi:thiamine biosynthesis protein ThiI